MRWPARLGATLSVLLLLSCASSAPGPPPTSPRSVIPDRPPEVDVDVEGPSAPSLAHVPWVMPPPRLHVHVRAPDAAVRHRARRAESAVREARRRLEGAWSFVFGETIGMAIFDRDGRLVLQALGGDKVALTYRVVRPPGSDPGRLDLRSAPDSSAPGPAAGPDDGDRRLRFRTLFKWRSAGQLDLQIPADGEGWPEEFGTDRYRLFRDVESALRFLRRRQEMWRGGPELHRAD